jgi:hypothetical protein
MISMAEPYDVTISGEAYQVKREQDGEGMRTCIYLGGQLRFSLPDDTPQEEVRKLIQVYTFGLTDGKNAQTGLTEDRIRGHLQNAARRLGRAAWNWKAGAK